MRREEFSERSPGELVPVEDGWAFLPNPLPPDLDANWGLHRMDERARGALGEFIGQARTIENDALLINPLLTREAVESNKIENTITRARDVLLQDAGERTTDIEQARDIREVLQYRHALSLGAYEVERGRPLSLHLIRTLHEELLRGTRGENRHPGRFRQEPVLIGTTNDSYLSARFVPAPWEHVPALMEQLGDFMAGDSPYSPLVTAALIHYQMETIHPFEDGNGRLGRLLIPLYLLAAHVIDRPILYLSAYFEASRDDYIRNLKQVSTRADWDSWLGYFLGAVESQARDSLRRIGLISGLREEFRTRARTGMRSKAALASVEIVIEKVIVSVQDVADYANCAYNTARAALDSLTEQGIVRPVPGSSPQRWIAQDIIDRVYET
jgi:Fic family protein